jgi:outer membrane protein OmpA-like peptidoglycan-associated protein
MANLILIALLSACGPELAAASPTAGPPANSVAAAHPASAPELTHIPVYFPMNTSDLTPEAKEAVDAAADTIKAQAAKVVIIVGSSGASGSEADEERLSHERAAKIEGEILARGVASNQITLYVDSDLTASVGKPPHSMTGRGAEVIIEPNSAKDF